jgi:hypothetical protein
MATDIKTLLNKKGWTGDEVGKAIIYSAINSYKQTLQGKATPTELFNAAQLKKMINSLEDTSQIKRYNRYIGLNNWVIQYQAVALAYYQQADGEINRLLGIITTAHAAEDEYKYIEKLPAIMTQKQYDEIREKRIEERLTDENGTDDIGHGIFNLIELAIHHFMNQLQIEPKKKNPLHAIKKKYQCESVKTARILSRYNVVMGEGYYILNDGRRSDKMTQEEWREAITTPETKKALKEMEASGKLGEGALGHSASEMAMTRLLERNQIIFQGGTEEEADRAQKEADIKRGWTIPCEWHYFEETPEDLTKWDILEIGDLFEYYPALIGEEYETYIEQINDFKIEFPELFNVIISEIDSTFFNGENFIANLPLEEWDSTTFTFRELYNQDFFGFRETIEDDMSIFDGNKRAIYNGIAILRPSDLLNRSPVINENGYYIEPDKLNNMSILCGLEQFTPHNEDYIANIERLEQGRIIVEYGYYYLLGYDKAIELIADYIDVPDFNIFKSGRETITKRIEALNGLISMLYSQIKDTDYRDKEAKEIKLQVLKDCFQPIKGKEQILSEEAINQANVLLNNNMKAFETQDGTFINILTTRQDEGVEYDD